MAATRKSTKAEPVSDDEQTRLVIKVPERVHRQVKSRAAAEGKTMAEYILEMLRERGIK